ncbi:MAG: amidohydrolase family protein [Gemmatimonadaceae bacterium]
MSARIIRTIARGAAAAAFLLTASYASAQTVAITGGRVFPVSGPVIENGTVLIRDGKIVAVGVGITVPAGARTIDASGKWVTPGLINSASQLGLSEIGSVQSTGDASARGMDEIAAAFTVWEGLNPQSMLFAPARDEGITTVVVVPRGGLIWGQAAVITLVEGSLTDMVTRAPVAMAAQVGNPGQGGSGSRGEQLLRLRELFADVRFFRENRRAFDRAETRGLAASRKDLEALIPVLEGRLPLLVAVDKSSDIEATLRLGREYGLRLMLAGAAEGWVVADQIAAAKIPVLTGAMNNIPGSFSSLGQRQDNAALLRRAGVEVLLIGNAGGGGADEPFNVRNIKQEAGNAVAYGMSWNDALRAVTLAPAQVFGVGERTGALQAGRDADVVIWSGDPFEFTTRAEHVFVRGVERDTRNRQELLTDRYKTLPPARWEP